MRDVALTLEEIIDFSKRVIEAPGKCAFCNVEPCEFRGEMKEIPICGDFKTEYTVEKIIEFLEEMRNDIHKHIDPMGG